jgi:prolipoprotein diacylglyceryltransferase
MIRNPEWAFLVHSALEFLAIAVGMAFYRHARRAQVARHPADPQVPPASLLAGRSFWLLAGLLAGAAVGNKLVFLIERPDVWQAFWQRGEPLRLGQSIVGGLLGGLVGIEAAKWLTRQPASTGDLMVLPLVVGMSLGRVGCFLAGLHDDTYGVQTDLPWAVDLGDGVPRHPTALYDMVFLWLLYAVLRRGQVGQVSRTGAVGLAATPGLRFKLFLCAYLAWRWWVDGLKPVPVAWAWGWSGIQWVCAVALATYGVYTGGLLWRHLQRVRQAVRVDVEQGKA